MAEAKPKKAVAKGKVKGRGKEKDSPASSRTRKKKTAKRGPGKRKGDRAMLTVAQYNLMWAEYQKSQSIKDCAKVAGVKYETAKKYITGKARPEDGLMPIKERYLKSLAESQREEELNLAQWQRAQTHDLRKIISLHLTEFALIQQHSQQRIARFEEAKANRGKDDPIPLPELEVGLDKLTKSMDLMMRLMEHMLGGSDLTVEHKEAGRFSTWTQEDKLLYATKGVLPEHER